MSTQEGNKIIATFMDLKNLSDGLGGWFDIPHYHSRWDYLMEVVGKIDKWHDEDSDKYFDELIDSQEEDVLRILDMKIRSTISEVWQAVIQFLTWYNQQGTKINR